MTASHHESTGSDTTPLEPIVHEDEFSTELGAFSRSVEFPEVEGALDDGQPPLDVQQHEAEILIASSRALAEHYILEIISAGKNKDTVLVAARADASNGKLLQNHLQTVEEITEYGPPTFEEFKAPIEEAANALRPNPGVVVTKEQENRIEDLIDKPYNAPSYEEAVKEVMGISLAKVIGDKKFTFDRFETAILADKILQMRYEREVKQTSRLIAATQHELSVRKSNGDKHVVLLSDAEIDEIERLKEYKLLTF